MAGDLSSNMLVHFSRTFPAVQSLLFITAALLGLVMIGWGLLRLLRPDPVSTAGSAVLLLICGSLLLALPETMKTLTSSFFAQSDPRQILSVAPPQSHTRMRTLLSVVTDFLSLVGWYAGMRGIFLIATANAVVHAARFGRGMTHLVGGVLLVNLPALVHAVGLQLGVEQQISQIITHW